MAYTTIDNPELYFQNKAYTGDGSSNQAITFDGSENMKPDWVWIKNRSNAHQHTLIDSIRGVNKALLSNSNATEDTDDQYGWLSSFDTNGFTTQNGSAASHVGPWNVNKSGHTYISWNWKAGGSAPAITYTVKVVSDSGNKYRFDDFGTSAVTLELQEGGTYTFDQSDSSNSGHPLRFSTTSNGTHGGGSEYTTGVTTTGTPGSSGAKTVITVAASAPTLYYYCSQHSGMGGQANTNSTFGSSNFSGSIQSVASANTTAGFSIVSYTGNGSAGATVGHGLGSVPQMLILKGRDQTENWTVYHEGLTSNNYALRLNSNATEFSQTLSWNDTTPTSSVFTLGGGAGTSDYTNRSGINMIAYCFAEKKGYSKFGSYTGNGNADGTFVYTGFKPAFTILKRTDSADNWLMHDNKRKNPFNVVDTQLFSDLSNAESSSSAILDYCSNGFKIRKTGGNINASGGTYIYMAFAESPFVNSNGVPNNAR